MLSRLLALAVLACAGMSAFAQMPLTTTMNLPNPSNSNTTAPYLTVQEGAHEQVSLATGSVGLAIPVVSLPQRGGRSLDLGFVLSNNTFGLKESAASFYTATLNEGGSQIALVPNYYAITSNPSAPLHPNVPQLSADLSYAGEDDPPPSAYVNGVPQVTKAAVYCVQNFVFTDWNGAAHPFHGVLDCAGAYLEEYTGPHSVLQYVDLHTLTFESSDGSYYVLDARNASDIKVTAKDGTVYHFAGYRPPQQAFTALGYVDNFPNTIVDPNGNTITINGLSSGGFRITDTVGRKIGIDTENSDGFHQTITYQATNGSSTDAPATATVSDTWTTADFANLTCTYNGAGSSEYGNYTPKPPQISVPKQIAVPASSTVTLPNGAQYKFNFNTLGQMSQITYPSGGYTRYDYAPVGTEGNFGDVSCGGVPYNVLTAKHECHASDGSCTPAPPSTTYGGPCAAGAPAGGEATTCYVGTPNATYGWEALDVQDPVGNTTHYDFTGSQMNVVRSLGQEFGTELRPSYEEDRKYYAGASTLLRTVATDYTANPNCPQFTGWWEPCTVTTTYNDASPSALSSAVTMQYDTVGAANPTQIVERDFSGNPIRTTTNTWEHSGIYADAAPSGTAPSHILDHLASRTIADALQGKTHTIANSYDPVGNLNSITESGTNAPKLITQYFRNGYGDLTQLIDPKNNATTYSYANPFADTACSSVIDSAGLPSSRTNAVGQVTSYKYNSCTGQLAQTTDPNGTTTATSYDTLGRSLGSTSKDSGSTLAAQDTYTYSPGGTVPVTVTHAVQQDGSHAITTVATLDGFGKPAQSKLLDPAGDDFTDYTYDALERPATVSNPHRATGAATDGITTYTYDALGRVTNTLLPDGSSTRTVFGGVTADAYDENGNHTQRIADALGRLLTVMEPDKDTNALASETDYTYDGLDNLTQVDQWGGPRGSAGDRRRTFVYDGLSRLLSAANPESGTVGYGYDNNGNVQSKTDARGVVVTYGYDGLNRLLGKTYNDGTLPVHYAYDESGASIHPSGDYGYGVSPLSNGVGRLTSEYVGTASPGVARKIFSYDPLGRMENERQCWDTLCSQTVLFRDNWHRYDLAGDVVYQNNSASQGFTMSYDSAGRLTGMGAVPDSGNAGLAIPLVTDVQYGPAGPTQATLGAGQVETWTRDNKLRVSSYSRTNPANPAQVDYSYAPQYRPNGNVYQATESWQGGGGTWTYDYDALNRLKGVQQPALGEGCAYTYDPWGNRQSESPAGAPGSRCLSSSANFDASNRILGWCYDAAGDLLDDGACPVPGAPHKYAYDGEGRLVSVGYGQTVYTYDAEGNRVGATAADGTVTNTVFDDLTHQPVAHYVNHDAAGQNQDLWWNGEHLGSLVQDGRGGLAIGWSATDWLGSERLRTDGGGKRVGLYTSLPFGEALTTLDGTDTDAVHFTGKERDAESGLDYFGARYYGSGMGRFMSPDPSNWGVDFYYPQTWNHYSYVGNNPLSNTDPNGLWLTPTHNSIINNSFPGLSKEQRQILQASSREVDMHQGQEDQFMHGMDSTHNNVWEGAYNPETGPSDYIQQNEQNAREIQATWIASGHTGIAPGALAAFGNALHTITDEYSPSHTGFQKVHWYSYPLHWREGLAMVGMYGNSVRSAEAAARTAFFDVFGSDLGQQATHERVTVRMISDHSQKLPDQQQ